MGSHALADFEIPFEGTRIAKVVFTGAELQRVYKDADRNEI